jgi:hypothetical protein
MGFEVINTTSELNKQGQVLVWRMPNILTPQLIQQSIATVPPVTYSTLNLQSRFPPATIGDAELLYGSRSWAAKEGAYVISRLTDTTNHLSQPSWQGIVISPFDVDPNATTPYAYFSSTGASSFHTPPQVVSDYDISGCHFTGLSFTTTLTVNVRWIIERMPGTQESDLVVLATPSAPYDPLALELYTQCMRDMPPGVMLSENPLGEWFRAALSKVADFAPLVGTALNTLVPGAGGVGAALGTASRTISNLLPTQTKEQEIEPKTMPSSSSPLSQQTVSKPRVGLVALKRGMRTNRSSKLSASKAR